MKKMIGILLASTVVSSANAASIVCKGHSSATAQDVVVEVTSDSVILSGGFLHQPRVITNLTHVNGLITAPGLALTMRNAYGCIKDAVVIAEFREQLGAGYMETINLGKCSGGSTSDELCGVAP